MGFKIGDKVMVMDEDYSGKIISVIRDTITIETEEGFLLEFSADQLLKKDESDAMNGIGYVPNKDAEDKPQKKYTAITSKKQGSQPIYEIDLHIGQLLPSTKNMNNHDILTYQIETAQRRLEFAIDKRIQRVVFIHGIGDGVLRTELEYLFNRYDGISFEDADYQKYGRGATQIYIHQNVRRN